MTLFRLRIDRRSLFDLCCCCAATSLQESQVKEVFRVLGKPTIGEWSGVVNMPHYERVKAWLPTE